MKVVPGSGSLSRPGQAHGWLAFSRFVRAAIPPSLLNMYKELEATVPGFTWPNHGYLESWARRGAVAEYGALPLRAGQAHSHASLGWGDVYR